MSAVYPSFQSLVPDIVELVLDYVFNFDARGFSLAKNSFIPRSKRRLLAILHSCHIWRSVLTKRYFNSSTLESSISSSLRLRFTNSPVFIDPLFYPTERILKSLVIDLELWESITSGEALHILADAEHLGLVLTSVNSLRISVANPKTPFPAFAEEPMDKVHSIVQFLTHVRRMVPNLCKVELSFQNLRSMAENYEASTLLSTTIDDLISGLTSVNIYLPSMCINAGYKLILDSKLVHFTCMTITTHSMWHIKVARYNANTLRELNICLSTRGQASSLIYYDTDHPIIYPLLQTLKVKKSYRSPPSSQKFKCSTTSLDFNMHVVHFPTLIDLCLPRGYPFTTNVLANDKYATIKKLTIGFSLNFIEYVDSFAHIGDTMAQLESIIIERELSAQSYLLERINLNGISNLLKLLQKPSPVIKRFDFLLNARWSDLVTSNPVLNILSNVKCINIPYTSMDFAEIVVLLRHAPNLILLTCKLSSNLPTHEGVHPRKMPSYVKANVFPIGQNLKVISDVSNHIPNPLHAYKSAALLAIACPNLACIFFPKIDINIVKYGIDTSTKMGEYVNYNWRLKKLFNIK